MKSGITREETTVLKAIAILMVILAHANGWKAFVGVPILQNSTLTSELCHGGMCVFLILSGYGLYCSYIENGIENWWDRKITKIFFPAMMIQIIWYSLFLGYSYFKQKEISISWGTVIGDILCVNPENGIDGSLWYLSYLLFCYVMFYFCFRYLPKKVAFPVFTIIWLLLMPVAKACWSNSYYCVSSFWIGVTWGKTASLYEIHLNRWVKTICIVLLMAVCLGCFYYFQNNWLIDNVVSNLMAFGFIIGFSMIDCGKLRVLNFIGKNSFILYLLQGKTICRFPYVLFNTGMQRVASFVSVLLVSIVLTVVINNALLKIEKTPNG